LRDFMENFLEIVEEKARIELEESIKGEEVYLNLSGGLNFFAEEEPRRCLADYLKVFLRRRHALDRDVCLDVNGEKRARRKKLARFARKAALRAKENGSRIRLNPMPSIERKWIHIQLSEVEGVRTYSVGQGDKRRVIVEPEKD